MNKPVIEGHVTPLGGIAASSSTYAWWLVLALVGLDCFSTLGYLPTIAAEGAGARAAPLAAVAAAVLILFAALPVYLFVVGRSPHGTGVTGLLEHYLSNRSGKLFLLFVLGFVATDFVVMRSLSTADASKHLLANDYTQSAVASIVDRKYEQLIVTVVLAVLGFALYFLLPRGFTRGFLYAAAAIAALFLVLNGVVIASSIVYLIRHPAYLENWVSIVGFASRDNSPGKLIADLLWLAVTSLPALVLGLSGFELSMSVAPLVSGRPDDEPARPRGRIRNMRKLLVTTAILMSVLVPTSVASISFLVPPRMMKKGGPARDCALAYLAHGKQLQPPGSRVATDRPHEDPEKEDDEENLVLPTGMASEKTDKELTRSGADLNPLFGPVFGTLYDVSAVLILLLAGASLTISLRDLLPHYLTHYGLEMGWVHRTGFVLHLFNLLILMVVLVFEASVSHQQGAYATSVLVLLAAAAVAAILDLSHRWRRSLKRDLAVTPLLLIGLIFFALACWVAYDHPAGLAIGLLFGVVLIVAAASAGWLRGVELRYHGFTFADEESGVRWEQIRRTEFQMLAPHRPGARTLAEQEAAIRATHPINAEVPISFVQVEVGDATDFEQYPLLRIVEEDGRRVLHVSRCRSIADVLAYIALAFRESGKPPEIHFALWGRDRVPALVRYLIRKVEPNPERQPRVVIG